MKEPSPNPAAPRIYRVRRARTDFVPGTKWSSAEWERAASLNVDQYPWDQRGFQPVTQVRLQYTNQWLYVIFRVDDRYIRCLERDYDGPVCRDSCVEMFFAPNPSENLAYFNIETNCGGQMLFRHQTARETNSVMVSEPDAGKLDLVHTMPRVVDPEVEGPVTWVISYRVPFEVLKRYATIQHPDSGVEWRANFYKCAVINSHPHYGSWAPVGTPSPDFHQPDFFGVLVFD